MKKTNRKQRFIALPGLKATSCLTVVLLIFLETVLLSTVSNCAKTFFMHWNTSNSIFRIDNTDHIIDVNKGNQAFEYDQVHIICPVYEPGTFDNETEKYIIYNVSKVEYETCRITNANPRIIAICDKPQKLMYFTITFRPFTPQPGGLEFLPGNDYYFISTSSKDDLHRRIGGRCSTNNMKVVFKVCCAPETDSQNATLSSSSSSSSSENGDGKSNQVSHQNGVKLNQYPQNSRGTSINTDTQSLNNDGRVPTLTINTSNGGNFVQSTMTWLSRNGDSYGGGNYPHSTPLTSTVSVQQYYPHPTSSRPFINSAINNKNNKNNNIYNKNNSNNNYNHSNYAPSQKPTKKTNEYDKHPNEVVKNEELTYNNNAGLSLIGSMRRHSSINSPTTAQFLFSWMPQQLWFILITISMTLLLNYYASIWHVNTTISAESTDCPCVSSVAKATSTMATVAAAASTVPTIKQTHELTANDSMHFTGHISLTDDDYSLKPHGNATNTNDSGNQMRNRGADIMNKQYYDEHDDDDDDGEKDDDDDDDFDDDDDDINLRDGNKTNKFDTIFNAATDDATANRQRNNTKYLIINLYLNNSDKNHNFNENTNFINYNNSNDNNNLVNNRINTTATATKCVTSNINRFTADEIEFETNLLYDSSCNAMNERNCHR